MSRSATRIFPELPLKSPELPWCGSERPWSIPGPSLQVPRASWCAVRLYRDEPCGLAGRALRPCGASSMTQWGEQCDPAGEQSDPAGQAERPYGASSTTLRGVEPSAPTRIHQPQYIIYMLLLHKHVYLPAALENLQS